MCTKQNDPSDMFQGTGPLMRVARLKWTILPVSASRHNSHKWKKIIRWQSFGFGSEQPKKLSFSTEQKKGDRCGFLKIVLKDKNHERWRSCWRSEEGHFGSFIWNDNFIFLHKRKIFLRVQHLKEFQRICPISVNHNFVLSPELSKYLLKPEEGGLAHW